jgi:hypothetical protein
MIYSNEEHISQGDAGNIGLHHPAIAEPVKGDIQEADGSSVSWTKGGVLVFSPPSF